MLRIPSRFVVAAAFTALAAVLSPGPVAAVPPPVPFWTATASLAQARAYHTATRLADGRVLVAAGNVGGTMLSTCQTWHPSSPTWTNVGSLTTGGRRNHAAVLLGTGKVLLAGGDNGPGYLRSAEIFDPATNLWTPTGSMMVGRSTLTLTRLLCGKVLAAGGYDAAAGGPLASCELYDPATGIWTPTGSLATARHAHTATRLADGRVLITGGVGISSCEIYDPSTGTWTPGGTLPMGPRFFHAAVLLRTGKALVAGGNNSGGSSACALFDPATTTWATTGSMGALRDDHTLSLLPSGRALVVGGARSVPGADSVPLSSAEYYDPATGAWSPAPSLTTGGRWAHETTTLADGRLLVTGGYQYGPFTAACEVFEPGLVDAACAGSWSSGTPMPTARSGPAAAEADGKVYVVGGVGSGPLGTLEAYDPASDTWAPKANMPTARWGLGFVNVNGTLFAIGGSVSGSAQTTAVEAYDPVSDSWAPKAPLQVARYYPSVGVVDGRIYVCGGHKEFTGRLSSVEVYDPATDQWSYATSMPTPRTYAGQAVIDGHLYVTTGSDAISSLISTVVYDPVPDAWSVAASLPAPRDTPASEALAGEFCVIGGYMGGGWFAQTWIYNPSQDTWRTGTAMPTARSSAASAVADGVLYVIGGDTGVARSAAVEAFRLCAPQVSLAVPGSVTTECQGQVGTMVEFTVEVSGTPPATSTLLVRDVTRGITLLSVPAAALTYPVSGLFPKGTFTIEAKVVDGGTELAKKRFEVRVVDTTPPSILAPADVTVECTGPDGQPVSLGEPTVSDLCDVSPVVTNDAPSSFSLGTTLVTWTATDHDENSSTSLQTVTVVDTTAPSIVAPADITVECTSPSGQTVSLGTPTVSDACDASPVVTNDAPLLFPLGQTEVTWTATDDEGNSASDTQTVTVVDSTAPSIVAPADITVECTSPNGQTVPLGTPTVSDACDASPVVTNDAPLLFSHGTREVTWTATDDEGHSASDTQKVTVIDTTAPSIAAPADVTVECTGPSGQSVNLGTPTVSDLCDATPTVTNDAPLLFPHGTTVVTWKAKDDGGNCATATQTVRVVDTTPPSLTPPADVTVECTAHGGQPVGLGTATAADACGPVTVCNDAPSLFPLGTTTVTWTAKDSHGLTTTATQRVTVQDTTAPAISGPSSLTLGTDCSGTPISITPATLGLSAADACDPSPSLTLSASSLSPGTTTVVATATDDEGNAATRTVTVTLLRGPFDVAFLQPLDASVDNLVKAGQTVPVKVQPTCGGVLESGATVTIDSIRQIDGSGTPTSNEIVEDSGLSNDGGNVFRTADGHYAFNLSTKGWSGSSGSRYRVIVRVQQAGHADTLAAVILKIR